MCTFDTATELKMEKLKQSQQASYTQGREAFLKDGYQAVREGRDPYFQLGFLQTNNPGVPQ